MATVTAPTQYPFGVPAVSGASVTVDQMLSQPTRITRYLSDLMLQNWYAQRIFSNTGGVTGGALLYNQLTANELYTDRDVQHVEPGAEFPIVTVSRQTPLVAQVEKFGGKFFVTDEARERNDPTALQQESVKLTNTITKKTHTRAIAVLEDSITQTGSAAVATGNNWSTVVTNGNSATNNSGLPAADFAKVQLKAEITELGVQYNLWLVNPQELTNFQIVYGNAWRDVLGNWGVDMVPTNRIPAGTAYVVAEGQVGEMRFEKPLSTETWREEKIESTWVQSSIRPVFAVTNPYAVVKVTGLAG